MRDVRFHILVLQNFLIAIYRQNRENVLYANVRRDPMTQFLIGIALIAFAAVLAFYRTQLAREGWTKRFSPSTTVIESAATRPYVIIANTELVVPTDRSKPVQVTFDLKNTGQTEAVGSFRDFTYYFSTQPEQREFAYQRSEPISFRWLRLSSGMAIFFRRLSYHLKSLKPSTPAMLDFSSMRRGNIGTPPERLPSFHSLGCITRRSRATSQFVRTMSFSNSHQRSAAPLRRWRRR
jgi:hypothetical protein